MKHPQWHEHTRRRPLNVLRIVGWSVLGVLFAALFALLFGWLVMLLWNWLMPSVFGLPAIGYWKAFGIVVLAKILFGGFGGHHNGHHRKVDRSWHARMGIEDDDIPEEDREHYRRFWRERGRKAFEEYLAETKAPQEPRSEGR
jgi:hypothetical protein